MQSIESNARYLASVITKRLLAENVLEDDVITELQRDIISRLTGKPYRQPPQITPNKCRELLNSTLDKVKKDESLSSVLDHNVTLLTDALDLPSFCIPVLKLCVISTINKGLNALLEEHIQHCVDDANLVIAYALEMELDELEQAVIQISNTPLFHDRYNNVFGLLVIPNALAVNLMQAKALNYADLLKGMHHKCTPTDLTIEDYPHLELSYISEYLRKAVKTKETGVNILLHGVAGTGKTELSKVLSRYAKISLVEVKAQGNSLYKVRDEIDNDNNVGYLRLQHYQLMQDLFKVSGSHCFLLDEIDDIFTEYMDGVKISKLRLHTLLDSNNVNPSFWITNNIDMLPDSVIRRFSYVLEILPPPKHIKAEILSKPLKGLRISTAFKNCLATIPDLTPAHIVNASKVAKALKLTGAKAEECINHHIEESLSACGLDTSVQTYQSETDFNPAYINIKPGGKSSINSIYTLIKSVKHFEGCRTLLTGVPGSGKSQLVHYLAEELEQELLVIQPADVLDMYVGQSEKRIRALFDEAHRHNKIMLIDECDSILRQRASAKNSWERSVVNQLLLSIERCTSTLFLCSNFDTDLDGALKRRIDFKVELDYLSASQTVKIYEEHFGKCSTTNKNKLRQLKQVSPGDIAVIARRNRFSKQTLSDSENIDILTAEIQHKQLDKSIGFIQ